MRLDNSIGINRWLRLTDVEIGPMTWKAGPLIEVVGVETRILLFCRTTITNQALVDREGSSYYYLLLTPRVFLPSPSHAWSTMSSSGMDEAVRVRN